MLTSNLLRCLGDVILLGRTNDEQQKWLYHRRHISVQLGLMSEGQVATSPLNNIADMMWIPKLAGSG